MTEAALAALCGGPVTLDDDALVALSAERRPAVVWAWWRLEHQGGAAAHPLLARLALSLAARDAVAGVRLRHVLEALEQAGVPVIVLKGVALAAIYPASWVRPRRDDDLLVEPARFEEACAVLTACGYEAQPQNPGPDVLGQAHFTRVWPRGDAHHVDLHWRALVPAAFDGVPGPSQLLSRAVPLPDLGPAARGPDRVDALLHAVAHRVAHHGPDTDPQWLLYLHLLAVSLSRDDWDRLDQAARTARLARVLAAELDRVRLALPTPVPAALLDQWREITGEPSAAHVHARGRLHRLWLDLRHRPSEARRTLGARLLPPVDYMTRRYAIPRALVPLAYGWRLGAGGLAWVVEALRRRPR